MIHVEGLVKRYRKAKRNAVDGIDFDVAPGEFFALLGPNGAGKTTTLSILTTTLAPTDGRAAIDGHDVVAEAAAVRRKVGIIFQRPSLDRNLTAEENVRFHAILYGLYPYAPMYRLMTRGIPAPGRGVGRAAGADEREIFEPVRTYSGGMLRKLEIVRSLIHRPRVLFLDEPTAGLDAPSRRTLWEYLARRTSPERHDDRADDPLPRRGRAGRPDLRDEPRTRRRDRDTRRRSRPSWRASTWSSTPTTGRACAPSWCDSGCPYGGGGPFQVPIDGRSIHATLRAIETPLSLVRTHSPTLEDAYLAIVGRDDDVTLVCASRSSPIATSSSCSGTGCGSSADFAFPLALVLLLGPALQAGFGSPGGLDLMAFVFTGVLAQTVWQSAALGLISLIADARRTSARRSSSRRSRATRSSPARSSASRSSRCPRRSRSWLSGSSSASRCRRRPSWPCSRSSLAHRRLRRRVRDPRPLEHLEPARGEPDLPVRHAAPVLPGRRVQPDPRPAAGPSRSCRRSRRCATRSSSSGTCTTASSRSVVAPAIARRCRSTSR